MIKRYIYWPDTTNKTQLPSVIYVPSLQFMSSIFLWNSCLKVLNTDQILYSASTWYCLKDTSAVQSNPFFGVVSGKRLMYDILHRISDLCIRNQIDPLAIWLKRTVGVQREQDPLPYVHTYRYLCDLSKGSLDKDLGSKNKQDKIDSYNRINRTSRILTSQSTVQQCRIDSDWQSINSSRIQRQPWAN